MNYWRILTSAAALLAAAGAVYLASRAAKFAFVKKIVGEKRWKRFLFGLLLTAALSAALYFAFGVVNLVICLLHLLVIWLLCDLAAALAHRIRRRKPGIYAAGLCAVLISTAWLGYGWFTAHHVVETRYAIKTDKDLGGEPLRIVMFADSHVGATFHADGFAAQVKRMEALDPDILVIVGDFVDDDTTREDMVQCCAALGGLSIREGIYFVDGNHDGGYFARREGGFTGDELRDELEKNGVHVLRDESVLIQDRFTLIGREDARYTWRAGMEELLEGLDTDRYTVVLDHQPHDYANQEKSGVDLVLSGHTHGGWLFPVNALPELTGTDDKVYGHEKRSNTDFIVTSGISEWALKFKTGTVSEYVVIDITD